MRFSHFIASYTSPHLVRVKPCAASGMRGTHDAAPGAGAAAVPPGTGAPAAIPAGIAGRLLRVRDTLMSGTASEIRLVRM
jgi:hypothetical protein